MNVDKDDISLIKEKVMISLLQDHDVVSILADKANVTTPAMELRYTQVFPWPHVPGTTDEVKTYITFEVTTNGIDNPAVKDYELRVYIFTHDSKMPFDTAAAQRIGINVRGTRIDILAHIIDHLLNGQSGYGFGDLKLIGDRTFSPCDSYFGRIRIYSIKGWNMAGEQL